MSTTERLTDFAQQLEALALGAPIFWPGVEVQPPSTGIWLLVRHFPNENDDTTWGADSSFVVRGFFQVEVSYRHSAAGIWPASELADTIIAGFRKADPIGEVQVDKQPWQSPEVVEDDRNFIPVTIPYYGMGCPE